MGKFSGGVIAEIMMSLLFPSFTINGSSREGYDIRKFWLIVEKDLRIEFRSHDTWATMMAFTIMVIFLFSFAVGTSRIPLTTVFPGILWLAFLFAGILGIGQAWGHETQEDTLTGLILAPGDRLAIFLAKLVVAFLFMMVLEVVASPIFFVLFNQPWDGRIGLYMLTLALGAIGFVGVGTLLSALAVNMRAGQMLLPVLLAPLEIPVMITAVQATTVILTSAKDSPWNWLGGLMAYDAIFLALPLLLYDYLWEV